MKQIKANNYEQVYKTFKAEGLEAKIDRVPPTIREDEKKYYHVVTVTIRVKQGSLNNHADVNVLQLHEVDYNRLVDKSNYLYHGINNLYVLHNPTLEADYLDAPKAVVNSYHSTPSEIKDAAKAEVLAELMASTANTNKEVLNLLKRLGSESKTEAVKEVEPVKEKDTEPSAGSSKGTLGLIDISAISEASYNDLRSFAKTHSIDLGTASKQVDILPVIVKWVEDHNAAL
ncbi:MAG: hypothetical protein ACPGRW_06375 [Flavobacteriaceae bacterium]